MPRPTKLYLAYGSNLHKAQMRRRCPHARAVGSIMLTDALLIFRGVADVIYHPGQQVPCGVWRITAEDEQALDRYEGIRSGFYEKEMVELDDGNEALLYVMAHSTGIYPPSAYYYETCKRGYADFDLDFAYLENALKQSYITKQQDEWTQERRVRQRSSSYQTKLAPMPKKFLQPNNGE